MPQPDGDQEQPKGSRPSDIALSACERADVQEVVGKETRGKLYKAALPKLMMQEWMGVDPSRAIADFDNAVVTFDHVSLEKPEAPGEPPYQQIVCTGHIQIDMSNATAGQQIVGVDSLRWVINISGQPDDPAKDAFTVDVDDISIQQGLTINGRSPVQSQSQEQAEQSAPADAAEDAEQAAANNAAEDAEQAAANNAADDAAKAAAEAHAAAAQAEAEIGSAPQAPTQPRGNNNQPSEEDLYAPH